MYTVMKAPGPCVCVMIFMTLVLVGVVNTVEPV